MAAVRKLDNRGAGAEFTAIASVAITDNPPPKRLPGGLFVKFDTDTDPEHFVVCGAGEVPIGTLHYNVAAGEKASIKAGIGELRLITLGDTVLVDPDGTALVQSDSAGKAIPLTPGANVGGTVTKAGVAGDAVPLLFKVSRPIA